MTWTEIAAALAAILLLAGAARLLKLGESRLADPARASGIAEATLAGFVARHTIVSGDAGAALVAGNGTIALLKRHGARVAVRRLVPPLDLGVAVEGVVVETGERMFGRVVLSGIIIDDVRALEALASRPTIH